MYLRREPAGEDAAQSTALLQERRQQDKEGGSVVNCSWRSSRATPTRIVTAPVRASIGKLGEDAPEDGAPT